MKQRVLWSFILAAVAFHGRLVLAHPSFKVRCDSDHVNKDQYVGRNLWALKCGYASKEAIAFHNSEETYVTFLEKVAPIDGNAPCAGFEGMHKVGWCEVAGCYSPGQRVLFGGHGWLPIEEAGLGGVDVISGFAQNWMPGDEVDVVDEKLQSFTVGDQFDSILVVRTESGKQVEVTDLHPLVEASGRVIKAKNIRAGVTRLLTVDGEELVTSSESVPYSGKVWNVEPASLRTRANLHLAEGFIAGSVRYQNEWIDDSERRALRDQVDVSNF